MKLVETADVFITSLRPKALTGLRLDPEDLLARNPKLIYARGNGLGFKGAEFNKAGYDASAFWARGGFADLLTAPDADVPTRPRPARAKRWLRPGCWSRPGSCPRRDPANPRRHSPGPRRCRLPARCSGR